MQVGNVVNSQKSHYWERCLNTLPTIRESTRLGLPVESAFSAKIQRRLASSVPPRPVIRIEFSIILEYLTRLCQHGKDVYRALDCQGGSDLMVRTFISACAVSSLIWLGDIRVDVSVASTSTIGIYQVAAPITYFQRNEGTWKNVLQTIFAR